MVPAVEEGQTIGKQQSAALAMVSEKAGWRRLIL